MRLPRAAGWVLLGVLVLALILVPFALGEERLVELSQEFFAAPRNRIALAGIVIVLLAADLLLPVPSSLVSAGAVAALGAVFGGLAVWLGMTAGAFLGYAIGRSGGHALTLRVVGADELERARRLHERFGSALLVVCRGVPVLAEASTLFAGVVRMRFLTFACVTALANAGLSLAYALLAGLGSGLLGMLLPFALGVALPALAILVVGRLEAKRKAHAPSPEERSSRV